MDALLARLGAQAMNMAIRSGVTITSAYAIQQYGRLVATVDDKSTVAELKSLKRLLDAKIKIISPTIDLIEFKSGRGNVFLESAVPLTKALHREIVNLGRRLEGAASASANTLQRTSPEHRQIQVKGIITDIKELLARIDRDIPLLQLAITASGESMSTTLPPGVSPSRLLQASTFLIIGDTQFATQSGTPVQIGPSFTLSLYMLFVGHSDTVHMPTNGTSETTAPPAKSNGIPRNIKRDNRPYGLGEGERKPIWQEVLHKTRVRLCRTPPGYIFDSQYGYHAPDSFATGLGDSDSRDEWSVSQYGRPDHFSYFLEIIEDLDDGRVHDEENPPTSFQDVEKAGIREAIPIHQLAKIFYTDTGRILNIGSDSDPENNSILLLKRDVNAPMPKPRVDTTEVEVDTGSTTNVSSSSEEEEEEQEEGDCSQDEINRQIRSESELPESPPSEKQFLPNLHAWDLPQHLDPEWLAFEVFADDNDVSEDSDSTIDEAEDDESHPPGSPTTPTRSRPVPAMPRSSLDPRVIEQIRNISLRSPPRNPSRPTSSRSATVGGMSTALQQARSVRREAVAQESPGTFVSRSPFGAITSSLSLLEMLVRLTSLQEFQQMSHLGIPDHILTFFLEETSTTGLTGSEKWKARTEAKAKVGFDPYTDTPARH